MTVHIDPPAVFLCGPISCALEDGSFNPSIRQLMDSVAAALEGAGLVVLSAHRQENYGQRIPAAPEDVFRRDWHLAQLAQSLIVVLPPDQQGRLFRTDGTFIELGWAVALGKSLFIVTDHTATGRSYLFDGLIRTSACTRVFSISEALEKGKLAEAIWQSIKRSDAPEAVGEIAFCCTSFGFGPVSKVVAVAEAMRLQRPNYRLIFIGSDLAEGYARSAGVFDKIISADMDTAPHYGTHYAENSQAMVNALNFKVLSTWSPSLPPHFFLDSLAWMWPSFPDFMALARAYFVQDYLLAANTGDAALPLNTVLVPPILSPHIRVPRAKWESETGYILINLAGCRNPILPPEYYGQYVSRMLAGLADALRLIDRQRLRPIQRVMVCGNGELLNAAESVDWSGLSFPVERRFIPPREFLLELRRCELLLTSPGLTTTLEALALDVPLRFLLPQNYSQFRIMKHYRSLGLRATLWPDTFLSEKLADPLLNEEEGVLEVSRLLQEQLSDGTEGISRAFQDLLLLDEPKSETSVLRQRILSWDGSIRVAQHVIREIETHGETKQAMHAYSSS